MGSCSLFGREAATETQGEVGGPRARGGTLGTRASAPGVASVIHRRFQEQKQRVRILDVISQPLALETKTNPPFWK